MKSAIIPNWPAPTHVKAACSIRPFDARSEEEKQALIPQLELPSTPFWLKQTHSSHVVAAHITENRPEADASFSTEAGNVCVVMTADCLPILLADKQGRAVAAIHAGWKGLHAGIIANTVAALPVPASDLLAWLGPCIGPKAFEVRSDVYQPFTQQWPETSAAFRKINDEQWLADLCLIAKQRLNHAGVTDIYGGEYCTHSDSKRFFSYRRDGATTGRMASLIWLC